MTKHERIYDVPWAVADAESFDRFIGSQGPVS